MAVASKEAAGRQRGGDATERGSREGPRNELCCCPGASAVENDMKKRGVRNSASKKIRFYITQRQSSNGDGLVCHTVIAQLTATTTLSLACWAQGRAASAESGNFENENDAVFVVATTIHRRCPPMHSGTRCYTTLPLVPPPSNNTSKRARTCPQAQGRHTTTTRTVDQGIPTGTQTSTPNPRTQRPSQLQ